MLKIKQIQFMFRYNISIGKNVISVALNVSYLVVRYRIVLDVDDLLTFSHTVVSDLAWCGEKNADTSLLMRDVIGEWLDWLVLTGRLCLHMLFYY